MLESWDLAATFTERFFVLLFVADTTLRGSNNVSYLVQLVLQVLSEHVGTLIRVISLGAVPFIGLKITAQHGGKARKPRSSAVAGLSLSADETDVSNFIESVSTNQPYQCQLHHS